MVGFYFPWRDYFPSVAVKNPIISDVVSQIYIWKSLVFENFSIFNFPLWDGTILAGTPLLASYQPGAFYPLNLFYLLFSEQLAFSFLVISQPLLSLLFTFYYLREFKLAKPSALFGAICFAFAAFAMVWGQWATIVHAGLYLPLVLLLIEKYLKKPKLLFLGLISLSLAFSVFAGHFQITLYLIIFSSIYALFRTFFSDNKKGKIKNITFLLLAFVLGGLISAIQLVPTAELTLNSFRGQENYVQFDNFGLISGRKLITFIAPDFFGNPTTLNYWDNWNYQESAFYLGILPLFFLGLLLLRKKGKLVNFYLVWLILSVFFIFDNPVGRLIYDFKVPFFSQNFASRGIYLLTFCVAVLAAFGFDSFLKSKLKKKELTILSLLVFLIAGILLFLKTNPDFLNKVFINSNPSDSLVAIRNLILPILLIFASWFLILITNFLKGKLRIVLIGGLFLIFIFDLFRFADKYLPFVNQETLFAKTPVFEFLQKQEKPFRIEKESSDILPANMWSYYGLEASSGYNPLYSLRYAEFISLLNTNQMVFELSRYALVRNFDSQLFDLLNNKYLLVLKRSPDGITNERGDISYLFEDSKFKIVFEDKSMAVLENTLAFPRAFLAEEVVIEDEKEEIAKLLLSKDINLRKTVILEEEPDFKIKEEEVTIDNSEELLSEDVEFVDYQSGSEKLRITANNDKLLFISETFYPGWKAFLDGKQVKIYRANYAFKAVFIPEGEHELEFIYQPLSFRIGSYLSLIGVLLCACLILIRKKS